jgi:pimeloyl-ACP methyl ester carboxylesterase/methionine-rich copper-binding protein CopC
MRKFLKFATAAAVLGAAMAPQAVMAAAPAPTLHNDNPSGNFGDWYTGAIPPNVDYNKPVILFVQGLHSDYTTWYNSDGFYDAAYNAGYRTAFVQLKDADGGDGGSMWTNGPVLANVINKVRNYYGVNKINIIAHSKGGIDTQTALVHYGAYPYVNVVHQLSTPNLGSELADLAYSDWTWWLAALMGQQDDAVYSLQTSYMDYFRSITDGRSENNYTRTYMSGGTGDDGFFSATYYSRAFLPGEDDGAVAIYSAFGLPYGYYGFTDNGSERLSHTKMRWASKTWWQVKPRLTTTSYYGAVAPTMLASANPFALNTSVEESSNYILRGGEINGATSDTFTLESGLNNLSLDVMTSSKATKVTLVSPSGKIYTPTAGESPADGILFKDAAHNIFTVDKPEAGTWTVQMDGKGDAYFLSAILDGGAKAKVKANKKVHRKQDSTVSVSLALDGATVDSKHLKKAKLTKTQKYSSVKKGDVELRADGKGGVNATFVKPTEPGVYNLSFDVVATNEKGESVTRSVNYNFAVTDEEGNLPK